MLKALFLLKTFTFLSRPFGDIEKRKKADANFKIHGVTDWTKSNCNTYFVQYLQK